ncbi:SusE domain-containing protein [Prolixibacter sp. NT017]|uniref:SusE domain-containing protein n=1 Tax=Prolixibacter sp. NT017 TaxID=2652390 RepID=UPI00126B4FF2|nr:SusE domain-containing protein [Prolixibacter sp. NT017]GET27278.1 hypothetical protein NT017_36070 [Prolixibacter sp. NT017]
MKYILNSILFLFVLGIVSSCTQKDLTIYNPDNATGPTLTMPSSVTMSMDNKADSVEFSWTPSDYNLQVAVTYSLQMDTVGDNFANAYTLYSGADDHFSITVGDLNSALMGQLELPAEQSASVEFRVVSNISDNVADLNSASQSIDLTPYKTVFPPIYMIGAATGGWDTSLAVEMPSTEPNVYSTIAKFTQDQAFRFFAQPDWGPTSYNYPYFESGTISSLLENAQDGDSNFQFLGATGYYRITVNLKTLTVDMTSVPEPVMYMTGAAIGGWDQPGTGASVKMTFVKENVWKGTADFISGEAFRFFAQADWGPTSYNYPYFADGTVDPMLEDAQDGDNNFKFTGTSGTYEITLNLNDLTVTMTAQ